MGQTEGQKVLLLMDNCSAHGNVDTLSNLTHVNVGLLLPNTTSKLQPLDVGIIAAIKLQYRRRQMKHAANFLEVDKRDIYKIDILPVIKWLNVIWRDISAATI